MAAPHAACPLLSHGDYADGTDRQTDGRHTVTLRFPYVRLRHASDFRVLCLRSLNK